MSRPHKPAFNAPPAPRQRWSVLHSSWEPVQPSFSKSKSPFVKGTTGASGTAHLPRGQPTEGLAPGSPRTPDP